MPPFYGTPNRGVPEKRPMSTRSTTRTLVNIIAALTLLAVLTVATLAIMIRRDADLIRRAEAWTGQECTKVGTIAIVCRPRDGGES